MQTEQFELHAEIEERHWWFVARRAIVRRLVHEVVPPSQGATIVDVGCGTGANLASLAGEYNCVGIDTSLEAIRLAQSRFPQVKFVHGFAPADLADVLPEARLITLMDVLEHVPDDFSLLSDLLSAAAPGTHLLVTVPADMSLWSQHDESFGHYRRYDLTRFEQLWQGLNVTPLMASYYNTRLLPVVKTVRAVSRWRGHSRGAAGTDFRLPSPPVNRLLTSVFAGEANRLVELLHGRRARGFRSGVSLIALLRREAGVIEPRPRPTWVASDEHDPAAKELVAV